MNNQSITSHCWRLLRQTVVSGMLFLGMLFSAQTALADGAGNTTFETGQVCMEQAAGFGLNCTANDISIAEATNIEILDDGCAFPGDTVNFRADFTVLLTAQERHDIGIWFAEDGGDALTGTCTAATPAYAPDPPWLDLDGLGDPLPGNGKKVYPGRQDFCGDIDDDHNPLFPTLTLTVECIDRDGDSKLDLPNCTSWRQPGANDLCETPLHAFPGAPSKCNCGILDVDITVPKFIEVKKVLFPEVDPGLFDLLIDGVEYATDVGDNGTTGRVAVLEGTRTVSEMEGAGTDLQFYDTDISCVDRIPDSTNPILSCTGCTSLDLDIVAAETDYLCTITNTLALRAPDFTVVKTNDANDDGAFNDTETVIAGRSYPVTVPYKLEITNNDILFGFEIIDLIDNQHNAEMLAGCSGLLNTIVDPGATESCTFNVIFDNADLGSITNTLNVTAFIEGLGQFNESDDSTVIFEPLPAIDIVKDGALDLGADGIANPGDLINYTFVVTNTGNVTLINVSVTDPLVSVGALSDTAGNGVTVMAPGDVETATGSYVITQADIDAGQRDNLATASGTPPVGPPVSDTDPHEEPIPQGPAIDILKDGALDLGADGIATPGDLINYTFVVTNTGNATLTNVSVTDPLVSPISCPGGNPVPSMAPGDVENCSGSYAITQADIDAGQRDNLATATGTAPDGGEVSDTDPHEEPIPQGPAIEIIKDGALELGADGIATPGDLINYSFVVTNTGNATLTNVSVTDPLVSPISCPGGNPVPSMAPGDVENCSGSYAITQADIDAGQRDNLATATGTAPDGGEVSDTDPHEEPIPQGPAIEIIKDGALELGADGIATPGDLINYSFVVTNTGNATLTNVSVTDPLVSPISCPGGNPVPSMAPGDVENCSGSYAITQADIDAGQRDNLATATGTAPDGGEVSDTDPHEEPIPQGPAIDIIKDGALDLGADGIATPGDLINYTFVVTNTGNATLTNVSVTDPLVSPISCPGGNPVPSMAPGDVENCSGSYAITQADIDAGQRDNLATATGTAPDGGEVSDTDPHEEPIPQGPAIEILKDGALDLGADGIATPGDLINYTFVVTNTGNVTLTNVSVTDPLVSPISCPGGNPVPSMAPGDVENCSGSYAITQADIDAGQRDNLATASGTPPVGPPVSDDDPHEEPIPQGPAIDILKDGALDLGADGIATPGDLINYTFVVTNTGNVTLTNVSVTDPLVSPISCPSGNPVPSMAPGDVENCSGSYAITQADIDAGQRDNLATATGTAPDGGEVSDTDPHEEPIPQGPAIEILKDGALDLGADGIATPGDLINYTFVVTNTGNVTLTNVSVTDPLVSPISCPGGNPVPSMAPGDVENCSGSYAITQADIDAGQRDNLATASGTPPVGPPVSDDDPHEEPIPQGPAIDILKDGALDLGADGIATPGDLINYTFVVTNTGNVTLTNVSVTDPLVSPISCPSGNPVPSMAPGDVENCSGSYAITQADIDAGQRDNLATASGTPPVGPPVSDDDPHEEPIPQGPAIDILKDGALDLGADGIATPGDLINYTFVVTNTGNATLTNVSVTDPLVSPISCPGGNPVPSMAPGDVENCSGSYAITQADIGAGQRDNLATASGTPPVGPPVSDDDPHEEPIPQGSAIDILKDGALDLGADGIATPGDLINYTFVVTNTGNTTLTNVSVTDPLVSPISCPGGNPVPSMAPGESETCTGSYMITQTDINNGEKCNTALATGTAPDGGEVNDVDSHCEDIPQPAVLFLLADEDAFDNGLLYWLGSENPNSDEGTQYKKREVNDQKPGILQRDPLGFFLDNVGQQFHIWTGQVGDEGLFAPLYATSSWLSELIAGNISQNALDGVPMVPLRADGQKLIEGRTVCLLVHDSDISINYPGQGNVVGNAQGEWLGIAAFDVAVGGVQPLTEYSSGTLTTMLITVRDPEDVCFRPLEAWSDAPIPVSSSEPYDITPDTPPEGYLNY
ncbi:DUF7507 domain-containing protein [Amphritea sp. HPY]|uniref:DUF7507 domain-containing protein n=1 Tax=Amphritea sp. HPY TaxID=3421652 RepID=UPI003D7D6ADD